MRAAVPERRSAQRGFVIVAVLWMLAAFAVLAGVYSVYVGTTATIFGMTSERLRGEVAAHGAVELVVGRLTATEGVLPAFAEFTFRIGTSQVHAAVRTEAGRIDLNAAPKELIAGLFATLGAGPQQAAGYADRIVAWRTPPVSTSDGADEISLYRAAGKPYLPRQSAFPHVDEVRLLVNLPEALVTRSLPFLTVYSGKPTINVLAAPPEVIAALPGMTAESTHGVLAQRPGVGRSVDAVSLLPPAAARYATMEVARAFQISLTVALDNGRRMRFESVVLVGEQDTEPYRTLSWTDLPDGPVGDRRR